MPDLGKLERVELRDVWKSEAQDFTPWLAKENNLAFLGDALNMELELKAQEKSVGPFSADILCVNTEDNSYVLIENQLETTNHKHLGQLMTYAAGLHAISIVWIAKEFTDEHRAVLDLLNEITDEKFRFFGLEIELWKIGDSLPAPKFNIVSKPNNWSRSVSLAAKNANGGKMTPTMISQLKYWAELESFVKKMDSSLRLGDPNPVHPHRIYLNLGRGGTRLVARVNSQTSKIAVMLETYGENAKAFFDLLRLNKEEIENALGFPFPLEWQRPDGQRATSILHERDGDILNEEQWPELHQWMVDCLEKMYKVFRPRVKALNLSEWEDPSSVEDA